MGNAQNTLEKSQMFDFSLLTSEKEGKWENVPSKAPLGLVITHVTRKQRPPRYFSRRKAWETPRMT